jgi:tripartite ATP-independent transporter DctP family solute receptor
MWILRRTGALGGALALLFAMTACGSDAGGAAADGGSVKVRFGHFAPAGQPMDVAANAMGERLQQTTEQDVEFQVFPGSQLGSIAEQLEQLQGGSLEMMFANPSYLSEIMPEWAIFDAPMVFGDEDHVREFALSDYSQELAQQLLEERGIRILDPTPIFGARHLSTAGKEVRTPADLAGMKIRVHEAATRSDLIKAWGANPVVTETAEMYTAMQTGLADGQESPLSWQADNNYWEVQDYVSLTGHFVQAEFLIVNEEFFQGLSAEMQDALLRESHTAADEMTELYRQANEEAKQTLEENGMTIIEDVDLEAFRSATEPMWDKWQKVWGEGRHLAVVERDYETLEAEEWADY